MTDFWTTTDEIPALFGAYVLASRNIFKLVHHRFLASDAS
jgi:hypothetical protein